MRVEGRLYALYMCLLAMPGICNELPGARTAHLEAQVVGLVDQQLDLLPLSSTFSMLSTMMFFTSLTCALVTQSCGQIPFQG